MNIFDEIKKIDSSKKKLREFGLVVGGVFAALGLLFLWRGKAHAFYFLYPGVALVVLGVVFPGILKPLQRIWMSFAVLMGWVMTRVILSLLFYLTITPIALILKMAGKDLLNCKLDPQQKSYWHLRPPDTHQPSDYERQF